MEDWRTSRNLIEGKSEEVAREIARQPVILHWVLWGVPFLHLFTSILSAVFIRSWQPWLLGNLVGLFFVE